ncbi:hypothetical protein [Gordonia tangerina]|uniref:DUF4307 domain-containing protein n=1 Tax=Gordonia tangerina TaxID=2911060 RepID=A0ABS9DGR6_9ACTN|nr:hypothetical protein [Gordonia tangerina]MCF3938405.1 hypothetical protein [Gordonia tangerina]
MTSAQPPRSDGWPHTQPEYWLQPGPMLPQRTWQRRTRSPIILVSAVAGLVLAAVAVLAVMVGSVAAASFGARGVVLCATGAADVAPGSPVRIYDETGEELASTRLGAPRTEDGRCEMPFTADDVPAARGGYVVRIGDSFQETVSESALSEGAVLRPVS